MSIYDVWDSVARRPSGWSDGMTIGMVKETRTPIPSVQRDTAPKRDAAQEKAKRKAARSARKRQR